MDQSAPTGNSSSGGGDGGGGGGGRGRGFGRCSKNGNQRKEPQRGPGVAQLERMRREEELRRINDDTLLERMFEADLKRLEANAANPNFRSTYSLPLEFPLPRVSLHDLTQVETDWRTQSSPQHQNNAAIPSSSSSSSSRTAPLENSVGANFDSTTMPPSIQPHGRQNEPMNFTNQGKYYSWPPNNLIQRPHQNQQPSSSSMVNFSTVNLRPQQNQQPSSSSMVNISTGNLRPQQNQQHSSSSMVNFSTRNLRPQQNQQPSSSSMVNFSTRNLRPQQNQQPSSSSMVNFSTGNLRPQQNQQPSSSSMVNFSTGNLRPHQNQQHSSSSMVNFSTGNLTLPVYPYSKEPPSNQNYSSCRVPVNPENKQLCGQKRSYPFSQDVPPASSSVYYKSPGFTPYVRANESTSRARGTGLNYNAASSAFRQVVPSSSTTPSSSEPNSSKKNFNDTSLSLAPPISTSNSMATSTFPAFQTNQEPPQPFQGTEEDQTPDGQQQGLHNYFSPEEEAQSEQTKETNEDGNSNGEDEESVDLDLDLKL